LRLASQNPSKREFFIPTRTDLGVKLVSGWNLKGKIGNISHRGDFFMFIPHRRLDKFFYHTFNS
jgi:hypothetical protein